jgi:glycosyltransferase involved in cell wall biosynthesis
MIELSNDRINVSPNDRINESSSPDPRMNVSSAPPRIVAFTKDWDDVPTCTTHILREMGKTLPVLWVNSIGTRKPRLGHPSHVGRVVRRLASGFRRAERKENHLRVLNPILIPKAQSRFAQWANRKLFSWQAGRELADMGDGPIEYWCFVPNAVDLLPPTLATRHSPLATRHAVVYYCVDDWSKFTYLDAEWISKKERELVRVADIIFTPARYLVEKMASLTEGGRPVHYIPHGVEYQKFRAALAVRTLPEDVAGIKKPVIGFYGNIYPWVDLNLVAELARRRPDWSFVLIGGIFCDVARLQGLANVHLLGRKEHDDLPRYCAAFDVGMIPYDLADPRMESVNPVKAREILAAGVPIVASDVPELRMFGEDVLIAKTPDEWVHGIERQMRRDDRERVSRSVQNDDWADRVATIRGKICELPGRKPQGR